jgi:hypothetical protein
MAPSSCSQPEPTILKQYIIGNTPEGWSDLNDCQESMRKVDIIDRSSLPSLSSISP